MKLHSRPESKYDKNIVIEVLENQSNKSKSALLCNQIGRNSNTNTAEFCHLELRRANCIFMTCSSLFKSCTYCNRSKNSRRKKDTRRKTLFLT